MSQEGSKGAGGYSAAIFKWIAGITATVIAGYLLWYLTDGSKQDETELATGSEQSVVRLRDLSVTFYSPYGGEISGAIIGNIVIEKDEGYLLTGCELKFRFPQFPFLIADTGFKMQRHVQETIVSFVLEVQKPPPYDWIDVRAECDNNISHWRRFKNVSPAR